MFEQMRAEAELPKYKCHKTVWALKIARIHEPMLGSEGDGRSGYLYPEDQRYGAIAPGDEYFAKHKPQAGGYYVVYEDGYKSYSPAPAFESGYTLIP